MPEPREKFYDIAPGAGSGSKELLKDEALDAPAFPRASASTASSRPEACIARQQIVKEIAATDETSPSQQSLLSKVPPSAIRPCEPKIFQEPSNQTLGSSASSGAPAASSFSTTASHNQGADPIWDGDTQVYDGEPSCDSCPGSPRQGDSIAKETVIRTGMHMVKKVTATQPFWSQSSGDIRRSPARSKDAAGRMACLTNIPFRCFSTDSVDVAGYDQEIEVPDDDITAVHIDSWEQRMDWRSFLSEVVATSFARQAFKSFDVEAEPPAYARPPPSS